MDVVFVNLPFAATCQPSLAFSLFQPILRQRGYTCNVLYPNLTFSAQIGEDLYGRIASYYPQTDFLIGELLFSQTLNDCDLSTHFLSLAARAGGAQGATVRDFLQQVSVLRPSIQAFVEDTAGQIARAAPRVVGLSSIFQQHAAALSVAKAVRARLPDTPILLGGSNCEGQMGRSTARNFDSLDFVISGPGEVVLPDLLDHLLGRAPPSLMNGVFPTARRSGFPSPKSSYAAEQALDKLPYTDFDDYFSVLPESYDSAILPFEGSRGCWWGAKNHCVFCGLNGQTMQMREKSPDRVLAEMRYLTARYPKGTLGPVDNIIPIGHFRDVFPQLVDAPVGPLFYTLKGNLKFEQLQLLKAANVVGLQPGIESLSDQSLRRMRKGISALQNVALMLNAKHLGFGVTWPLLFGFPGETEAEYIEQRDIIRAVSHLPPPITATRIRIDRFSPIFERQTEFGVSRVSPVEAYHLAFPTLDDDELGDIAYYFDGEYREREMFQDHRAAIETAVEAWRSGYLLSYLAIIQTPENALLIDTREGIKGRIRILDSVDQILFAACRQIVNRAGLVEELKTSIGEALANSRIDAWIERRCILASEDNILSVVERDVPKLTLLAALAARSGPSIEVEVPAFMVSGRKEDAGSVRFRSE